MKNKRGKLRSPEEWFNALISLVFGIIFLQVIFESMDPEVVKIFKDLGELLIVVGIITLVTSLFKNR